MIHKRPMVRNYVVTHPALVSAPFFSSLLSGMRFLYPTDVSVVMPTTMGMLELDKKFEKNLGDLSCWTITRDFIEKYPIFEPVVPVFEDQPEAKNSRVDSIMDNVEGPEKKRRNQVG